MARLGAQAVAERCRILRRVQRAESRVVVVEFFQGVEPWAPAVSARIDRRQGVVFLAIERPLERAQLVMRERIARPKFIAASFELLVELEVRGGEVVAAERRPGHAALRAVSIFDRE